MVRNLRSAIELYDVLSPYLPFVSGDMDALEYAHMIIQNIRDSDNHKDYLTAVQIMTGAEYNILIESGADAVLDAFMQELSEWHILELQDFFMKLGYTNGR